nr:hypothetical protein [Frankia sp. Cj5]
MTVPAEFLVHAPPGPHRDRPVAGRGAGAFGVRRWLLVGCVQGQPLPVPAGGAPRAGRAGAGVGVEDTVAA